LVDLSTIVEILKNLLDRFLMPNLCGSDEVVIRDSQSLPERLEAFDHFITVSFWIHASILGGFFHLLAMLIRAREEKNLIALQPFVTSKNVSGDRGIGVADMGNIIDIVDRGGNVEGLLRFQRHGW
jgi:hypothetical protein